jgi:hypothetical protein
MSGDSFRVAEAETGVRLRPAGSWTAEGARALVETGSALGRGEPAREIRIELDDASALDATGGWLPRGAAAGLCADAWSSAAGRFLGFFLHLFGLLLHALTHLPGPFLRLLGRLLNGVARFL